MFSQAQPSKQMKRGADGMVDATTSTSNMKFISLLSLVLKIACGLVGSSLQHMHPLVTSDRTYLS